MAQPLNNPLTIEVSRQTYDRLQDKAVPFEDTPDSVITRLLNESDDKGDELRNLEASLKGPVGVSAGVTEAEIDTQATDIEVEDPTNPPSLKHTKILRAEVDGREIVKANWTTVRQSVLEIALRQLDGSLRRLLEICPVNAIEGRKEEEGFTYYPHLKASIQGQDANHSWQAAAALAEALGTSVRVWFQWRTKRDAAHPGKRGMLNIS